MNRTLVFCGLIVAAWAAAPATAQDSTSVFGCLPGDAVRPWHDAAAPNGSEQINTYVVDLTPFMTSWNTRFGVAPVAKASASSSGFTSSLLNAQGLSRRIIRRQDFAAGSYALWNAPAVGVNNDPNRNVAPTSFVDPAAQGHLAAQLAAVFAEFGTTDNGATYNGVIGTQIDIDPSDPTRLFVRRVQAGVNGCTDFDNNASVGVGSIDETGKLVFRADGFGVTGGCNGSTLSGDFQFMVDLAQRDPNVLNVISNSFPFGFDGPATTGIVVGDPSSHNCPNIQPGSITGGLPNLITTNFLTQFVRGDGSGPLTAAMDHLCGAASDHRGNPAFTSRNFAQVGSTHGTMAILTRGGGNVDMINVWGIDASANVLGTLCVTLPPVVTDCSTGFQNLTSGGGATPSFDHYHSQTAFQGGSGQVAIGVDPNGDLLLAAQAVHPSYVSNTDDVNYIPVARVDKVTGAVSWTMAGYNDDVCSGKPILDGPAGGPIGRMVAMKCTGALQGPSVSAPMIDSAGNVWFYSAVELFEAGGSVFTTALLRAVYDPTAFCYELELVLDVGSVFAGQNSTRDYQVSFMPIFDSNSVSSATAWSQNISEDAFLGFDPSNFAPSDPRSCGGVIIGARITYDANDDGLFDDCAQILTQDENYNVILLIAPVEESGVVQYGSSCAGAGGFAPVLAIDGFPAPTEDVTLSIAKGLGGQLALLALGTTPTSQAIGAGCFLNVTPFIPLVTVPLLGAGAGNGGIEFTATLPITAPVGATITLQAFCGDPTHPLGFTASNGVAMTIQN